MGYWVWETPEDAEAFANVLDDNLKKLNSDYEAKRYKGLAMERLKLHIAPSGTFMKWLKIEIKLEHNKKYPDYLMNVIILKKLLN